MKITSSIIQNLRQDAPRHIRCSCITQKIQAGDKMNSMKDCYELENGVKIPCMGYGTYKAAEGNNEGIIKNCD